MNKTGDAIDLVLRDHRELRALFAAYRRAQDSPLVQRKRLAKRICSAVSAHLQLEEELLYPALWKEVADEQLTADVAADRTAIMNLVANIESVDPDGAQFNAWIASLADQVAAHVESEERSTLPKVRAAPLDLYVLGQQMNMRKQDIQIADALNRPRPRGVTNRSSHGAG